MTATGQHVRLTAPFFDVVRLREQMRPPQLPGMSISDVEAIVQSIRLFEQLAAAVHLSNDDTLRKTLQQLEDHHRTMRGPRSGGPTPREPLPPPEPSGG
jgi:hypothetical protein